jgi:MoaA/NifB/PqqE/SkfB family radical SAM enzyme
MWYHSNMQEIFGFYAPNGIGAKLKGWDVPLKHYYSDKLPVVDFRAFTEKCPLDCFHCFTNKNKKTLTLGEIKGVIDQLADMDTYAINYVGEGEPTIDRDFMEVVGYTSSKGIIPVVFTEASTRMGDRGFVREVKSLGASVVPKCDSLFNAQYQNWVVGDRTGKYFVQRNVAVSGLMEEGFNEVRDDGATRMGFDMVLSTKNMNEVGRTLRYCRDNNLWIVFSYYLPSGRSAMKSFDKSLTLSRDEKRVVSEEVKRIDSMEYSYDHPVLNNFLTCGCVEYMQIFGDGRVSPCPGNESVIGNVRKDTIKELKKKMTSRKLKRDWDKTRRDYNFDGSCVYREKI